jgi:hypothetical protein
MTYNQPSFIGKISSICKAGILLILFFNNGDLFSQSGSTVSGKVTDAATGLPLPFVTVFLANTTIGTRTGEDGVYRLQNIPPGKYDLTVSSVGYKMKRAVLSIVTNIPGLNVALEPSVAVLKEVVVKSGQAEYLKNVKIFKDYFLGQTQNADECTIKNIDAIELWFDHESNIFIATCDQPIEIENKALGYRVFYTLQQFKVDFNAHISTCQGVIRFELLGPEYGNKVFKFAKERDRAYYGSVNHLMRSLRSGKLASNKFDVSIWRRAIYDKKIGAQTAGTGGLTTSTKYNWYPINGYAFHQIHPDSLVLLKIVYKGAKQEFNYNPKEFKNGLPQTSTLEYLKHGLVIHENGYYDNQLDFFTDGYFGFRETVANLLPYDYQPTLSLKEQKTMDKIEAKDAIRWSRRKDYQ